MNMVKHWNLWPRLVVDAPSMETFKVRLLGLWATWFHWGQCRGFGLHDLLKVWSNTNYAMIFFHSNYAVLTRRHSLEWQQRLKFKRGFSALRYLFFHRPRAWQSNCVGYRTLLVKPTEMRLTRKLSQVWRGFLGEFQMSLGGFMGLFLMNSVLCFLSILWLMNMKEYLADEGIDILVYEAKLGCSEYL